MSIHLMLVIILMLLVSADIGRSVLRRCDFSKGVVLFFLFSMLVLNELNYSPNDEVSVSPACLIMPIWIGAAGANQFNKRSLILIPMVIAASIIGAIPGILGLNGAIYLTGAVTCVYCCIDQPMPALTAAAITPIISTILCHVYEINRSGFAKVVISSETLCAQLVAIALVYAVFAATNRVKDSKNVHSPNMN